MGCVSRINQVSITYQSRINQVSIRYQSRGVSVVCQWRVSGVSVGHRGACQGVYYVPLLYLYMGITCIDIWIYKKVPGWGILEKSKGGTRNGRVSPTIPRKKINLKNK